MSIMNWEQANDRNEKEMKKDGLRSRLQRGRQRRRRKANKCMQPTPHLRFDFEAGIWLGR
jgi:hypothetical protein